MRLAVTINAGIGDIIHCHAMLDAERHRYERIEVGLNERGLEQARNAAHIGFARRLAALLFSGPPFVLTDEADPDGGLTPQQLCHHGFQPLPPDLRRVLPLAGEAPPPFVAVSAKVRGWPRHEYEAIRETFLGLLEDISLRLPLVLVGERVLSLTREYAESHCGRVYSIYDDLSRLTCIDNTFPEFGESPAGWDQFRSDCTTIYHAERVITLGSGGNVSMAMACGRCLAMIGGTEMGEFFEAMPEVSRLTLCTRAHDYLVELEDMT